MWSTIYLLDVRFALALFSGVFLFHSDVISLEVRVTCVYIPIPKIFVDVTP
jgi:hypothetical protein